MLPIIKPEISRCVLFSFGLFLEKQREKGMLSNSNVCVSIPGIVHTLPMYVRKDRHSQCMWRKPDVTSVCEGREVLPMYVKEARLWQCMWRKPDVTSVCEGSKTFPVCVKEARRYQLCEGSQTRPELLFKLSSTPFWLHFFHINKSFYRKIKQCIFIYTFIRVLIFHTLIPSCTYFHWNY